ncbi:MAG: hypothetical protein CVV07_03715 [Gammaproteobacteria bacterium HGW-Gammaproteobacteria-11]|nr:MAG: hypothetical protein CVV07_03715 [Gammaproteobacteria bacterium HGW-Gammaproteobacteria-11]
MNNYLIFFPVALQILLTLALYFLLSARKRKAAREGRVDESRRGIFDDAWPVDVILVNNCIRNQFEVPVLFYVLAVLLWALNGVDLIALLLAGLFVLSRVVHALIHTGSNHVPTRRRLFMFGVVLVMLMLVLVFLALFKVL